jgi:hypothetical protein
MYACVVKNDEGTWDIFDFARYGNNPVGQERLVNAVESGLPITGMKLTPYKWSATPGAVWDGEGFSGGPATIIPPTIDWNSIDTYGFLCDNVIVYGVIAQKDTASGRIEQLNAIFAGDTEVTIVELPQGQAAKIGDIWDGEKVISV